MALDKSGLQAALQTAFEDLGSGKTAADAATDIADAVDAYVKEAIATVTVPAGTFLVAAMAGVPNPAPVPLTGDPDAGTGGLS